MYGKKYDGIGTGYRSLDDELKEMAGRQAWVEVIAANREALDGIADIVRLGVLWERPDAWRDQAQRLSLEYTGGAYDHTDAAADLSRIMDALQCTGLELKIYGHYSASRPYAQYEGEGQLGDTPVRIALRVSWLPDGCTVHTRTDRRWHTERTYTVSCGWRG